MQKQNEIKRTEKEGVKKGEENFKNQRKISQNVKAVKDGIEARKKKLLKRVSKKESIAKSKKKMFRKVKKEEELDVKLVSIRRVSKVKAGGKRLRLSVMVVVGDNKGKIGVAIAKGKDVKTAQEKAVNKARKRMIKVQLKGQTIPHEIIQKYKAAKVVLKPAAPGTGVIAGGAVRSVVEAAGIKDILTKELGSNNSISNVYATFQALKKLKLGRFNNETK